jgi:hypothetical protein
MVSPAANGRARRGRGVLGDRAARLYKKLRCPSPKPVKLADLSAADGAAGEGGRLAPAGKSAARLRRAAHNEPTGSIWATQARGGAQEPKIALERAALPLGGVPYSELR